MVSFSIFSLPWPVEMSVWFASGLVCSGFVVFRHLLWRNLVLGTLFCGFRSPKTTLGTLLQLHLTSAKELKGLNVFSQFPCEPLQRLNVFGPN